MLRLWIQPQNNKIIIIRLNDLMKVFIFLTNVNVNAFFKKNERYHKHIHFTRQMIVNINEFIFLVNVPNTRKGNILSRLKL